MAPIHNVLALIDLERYPVHDLDSRKGYKWVQKCREEIESAGACNLEGFIHPQGLKILMDEADMLLPDAVRLTIHRNVYGKPEDKSLAESHPLRRFITHRPLQLANDQIPQSTLLSRLYRAGEIIRFVAEVQGKEKLHCYADRFQGLNIVAIEPGEWHAWHFDHNECTVTLLLQAADEGGEFKYISEMRTADDDNYRGVEKFLDGDRTGVKSLGRTAGTFTLFRGEYALHGVGEVIGKTPRVTAIFTYDEQPGRTASNEVNIQIYGERAEKILSEEIEQSSAKPRNQ